MYKPQSATKNKHSTKKLSQDNQNPKKNEQNEHRNKKAINQQNIKQFKAEIDDDIAKCLDTLDRQGLKYLRETLRLSNIFNDEEFKEKTEELSEQKISQQKKINKVTYGEVEEEIPEDYEIQEELGHEFQEVPVKAIVEEIPQTMEKQKNVNEASKPFVDKLKREKQTKNKVNEEVNSEIDELVERINRLPEAKFRQLSKILDRLEKSQKIIGEQIIEQERSKSYVVMKPENFENMRPQTVKPKKKGEKATSLYENIILGKKKEPFPDEQKGNQKQEKHLQEEIGQQIQKEEEIPVINQQQKGKPLEEEKNMEQSFAKKEEVSKYQKQFSTNSFKKNSFVKNFPLTVTNPKKSIHIEEVESINIQSIDVSKSQSRFVKLGKKKLGKNKVAIILLKNRGHPSIIGLTSIEIFNSLGKYIQITMDNIKKPNNSLKAMKLFNGVNLTTKQEEMFVEKLSREPLQIELQLSQKIGGIRLWNYNKSEIQSTKEVEKAEIYINDKLEWSGEVRKGSYNELESYETQITLQQNFSFPSDKKTEESLKPKLDMGFKKKQKNTSWLEKTLIEKQIKDLQEKQQKTEEQNKNQTNKLEEKPLKVDEKEGIQAYFEKSNDGFKKKEPEIKQLQQKKMIKPKKPVSKRLQDQIDIFGSLIQNQFSSVKEKPVNVKPQVKKKEDQIKLKKEKIVLPPKEDDLKEKKNAHERSLDDFMNDSLFQEAPKKSQRQKSSRQKERVKAPIMQQKEKEVQQEKINKKNVNLDDFINELNDVVGSESKYHYGDENKKQIVIPELPKGSKMILTLLENWGDPQYIGLNKIQLFDQNGQRVFPYEIRYLKQTGLCPPALTAIFSNTLEFSSDKQWKEGKRGAVSIEIGFSKNVQISLIRIWNYWGDRVHSTVGVKKMQIIFDGNYIFVGNIKKSSGSSEDAYKSCQYILFTNNIIIQKRIRDNDWVNKMIKEKQQEKVIFRKTIQNFHRPITKEGSNSQNKGGIKLQPKAVIKLPKRPCFEYEPPNLPGGYFLKILLHQSWGDRDFIGLNGIVLFDEKGDEIKEITNISEYPGPLSSLPGYENDKRVVKNLLNNRNLTDQEEDTWLSPFQTDMDKIQKKTINMIIVSFAKGIRLSGINIYNYMKHPARGAKEIEIIMDESIVYKGYVRISGCETETHTTINFTKDMGILQKMNYMGYHEDNLQQNVMFVNEGKMIKK